MASNNSSSSSLPDAESQKTISNENISHWRLVRDPALVTERVLNHHYQGSGTDNDPYLVEFIENDPRNPLLFPQWKKWLITIDMAIATLAVAFVSSAYTGGIAQLLEQFRVSSEVITLGVSLFVLGFAIGPVFWAPLSELYGRQVLFTITYGCLTAFNAGAAAAQNVQTLLILRFLAGCFGSSPLTNAGGVIADMFNAEQRGIATSLFAVAPFMGPVLGPIVGGFAGQSIGWRWVEGIMAIFTGTLWIVGSLTIPETYAPFLLQRRAAEMSKETGKVYISFLDAKKGKVSAAHAFKTALSIPWVLLVSEPIVLLLSVYMAIIYGTLYLMFGAFPIVFQQLRGWNEGIGGLAFVGVAIGMLVACAFTFPVNNRYTQVVKKSPGGVAPPEARLPPAMIGSIALPIGLFWFAWTCAPVSIPWIVSIMAGAPFGFGMVIVFLSIMNYLIDSYTIYAASALAANSVLRSTFGAVFPLFTSYMYRNLGPNWASSVPAFLALACVPFPFLFYKYGAAIRMRCKFAAQAAKVMEQLRQRGEESHSDSEGRSNEKKEEGTAED